MPEAFARATHHGYLCVCVEAVFQQETDSLIQVDKNGKLKRKLASQIVKRIDRQTIGQSDRQSETHDCVGC